MKTINGYSKETFTDDYVLLANGGTKDLKHLLQYFDDATINPNIDALNNTPYLLSVGASGNYGGGTKPSGSHNGFAVLNTQTHSGNYYTQLGFDTNQNYLWIRSANNTSTYGSWARLAMASELTWDSIASKPASATRWPTWSEVTDKPDTATRWPTWDEVTSKPDSFTPSNHMYHPWGSSEYYSDVGGANNLSILTETRKFDTLRFSYGNLTNLQYHNGSSWVSWSNDVGALFDGSRNTGVTIDKTHRKFRFETIVSSSWPSNSLLVLYTGWFNSGTITKISSKYYVVVTFETRANTSASYTTADTIQFTNPYMGMLAKQVNGLHTGNSYYRITIEFASWETSNTFSFTGISLYSDFGGNPLTMIRHTGTGDVIPYSSNSLNLGTSSTYWKNVYAGAFVKKGSSNQKVLLGDGSDKDIGDFATAHDHPYLPLAGGTMTGGNIAWNTDSHGVYLYNNCGIEKWSGYGPSLVAESGTTFEISSKSDRSVRYTILHGGNYTSWVNTTNFPGLNKTGTVTSITLKAGTGISLDTDNTAITSSGTRTITNAGVRAVTINGNALRVNTNGTNDDLTIPYATSASDSTKVAGYSVAFNKLYYKSKEVTMTTVQAYWYVKISLSAYAQPTQIFVSCSYNNEIDRAIIEFSGMSGGFIYRNCNQNQGNIKGIWFAGAASPWAFWLKFDKILNTSALHYSPSSSATCTVYLADNNASFNVEATTTEPSGASWISTGDASNNIIIRNAYLIGSVASADYATSAGSASYADSAGSASSATDADKVDGYHASDLVKFYLSPMTSNAPAASAKSWFTDTMPSSSGAIVYNVPGSEKTIIAGKSSGSYGHMLQLSYDDNYLRILRYKAGSWQSTDWEKISAGLADAADTVKTVTYSPSSNVALYPTFVDSSNSTAAYENVYTYGSVAYYPYVNNFNIDTIQGTWVGNFGKVLAYYTKSITGTVSTSANSSYLNCAYGFSGYIQRTGTGTYKVSLTNTSTNKQAGNYQTVQCVITPVYTSTSYEMAMINFDTYSTSVSRGNSCTWTFYTKRLHCQGNWSTSDFVQLINDIGFTLIIFGYGTGWGVKRDDG